MSLRIWTTALLTCVILLSGVALGVLAAFFFVDPPAPPSLSEAQPADRVSITPQPYSDPQEVSLSVTQSTTAPLRVSQAGVLTSINCAFAEPWRSGQSTVSVDGSPLINLHTSVPLWREIAPLTRGADVSALKAELTRLGFATTEGDTMTWADLATVRQMFTNAESSSEFDSVLPSQFIWLPATEVLPRNCAAALGTQLGVGDPIAEMSPGVGLILDEVPTLRAGTRELIVDQVKIALTADLRPQDAANLGAILQSPSYRNSVGEESATEKPVTLSGTVALIDPIEAVPLPPAAITITTDTDGCVVTLDGDSLPVTIVSSELGRTLVIFDQPDLPTEVKVPGPARCE